MKLKSNEVILKGPSGKIFIKRNSHGIPEIRGMAHPDLAYGLGWIHAHDRPLQTQLTRILLQGRASEALTADPALVEIDRYMRRMNFLPDPGKEIAKIRPNIRNIIEAYCDGYNLYLSSHKPIFEFRLLGYTPEPWEIKDSLILGKIIGFLGLADAQGAMEKFLVQMIQNDVGEKKLKELFPYLKEKIDYDLMKKVTLQPPLVPEAVKWLQRLPRFSASNNWVVSGRLSESGRPVLCSDPHLEVNRIPSIWMESIMRLPGETFMGATLPGVPGLPVGRTGRLAWGPTYSFMDMIDFRIEHCREGKYKRGNEWKAFKVREEIIKVKKRKPVVEKFYENELGVLEGDPHKEGHYLIMNWSAASGCGAGDLNGFLSLPMAREVKEAMDHFKMLDALSFNWVIADTKGNIGYQMSGRLFNRPAGVSGLLPLPAWERKYDARGFVPKSLLPSLYNPRVGYIVTANQDLNHLGKARPINLPMASYRADRIEQLLAQGKKMNAEYMKSVHQDLFSLQAERFMKVLRPMLPDNDNGKILKDWNCIYTEQSLGAMLFESVYLSLLRIVFGDHGMGKDVVNQVMSETGLFNDYYGNFDDILMRKRSAWFDGKNREDLFRDALDEGLKVKAVPYGQTRRVIFSHLLFGGKFPLFFGFDYGPIPLPGNRATVPQGQIFRSGGRITTFCPSFRMIADMGTGELQTSIAGGNSDRRFSPWYLTDLENWRRGIYKKLI